MTATAATASSAIQKRQPALLPFPQSVGMLLGLSLCAHLAAIVYAFAGAGLAATVSFGVGELALSLGLLRLYNGVWVFQDIRMPFVIFMFLYGFSLAAIDLANSAPYKPGLVESATLYGTAFVGFNFVQWWYKQPWRDVPAESLAWARPTFANAVLVLLAFAAVVGYAWLRGVRTFLTLDRSQFGWIYTQTWVVSMMLMNGFVMYMFAGWPKLSRSARRLVFVTLAAYVIFHIGLGNRRDFLTIFIFLAGIIASRRRAVIGIRTVLIALVVFVSLLVVGVIRQVRSAPWQVYNSDHLTLMFQQNEFVYPIQTIMYYVTVNPTPKYGMTYLSAPTSFIPRAVWPEKPIGLSNQFNMDKFGNKKAAGYAYTPITEAFLNFSFVGPFIVVSLISLAMVFLVKHARRRPMLYFVCFSLALEFNRSHSQAFFYFLVVIGIAISLMKFVSRIDWAPKAMQEMWPPAASGKRLMGAD